MYKLLLALSVSISCSLASAELPAVADRVVVIKAAKKMYLVKDGIRYLEFPIALGPKPNGHKMSAGDERTPEGSYTLDFKNQESRFYKSIHISYPNLIDLERASASGIDPGGLIMIHGMPNDTTLPAELIQQFNWTDGCIAVTNGEMDTIWAAVETGTPIDILP